MKSYRDVLMEFETHPETKSADSDGNACSRTTRGILHPREVHAAYIRYIGKESNLIEEVESGLVHDWDHARAIYDDSESGGWNLVVPILKEIPRAELQEVTGLSEREVRRICSGRVKPMPEIRGKLLRVAAEYAGAKLGTDAPTDDLTLCVVYLHLRTGKAGQFTAVTKQGERGRLWDDEQWQFQQ